MDFASVEDSSNKGLVAQESSSTSFVQNLVSEISFIQNKKEDFFLVRNGNGLEVESISDSNNNSQHIVESFTNGNLEGT